MNETLKVLETRRSCRNFKPDMIKDDELKAIVKAGTFAATGMGKQSPLIIAVTDKSLRDEIIPGHWDMFEINGEDPELFADYIAAKYGKAIECRIPEMMKEIVIEKRNGNG